ncbi:MAG: purine-nucleoside phosphorylase [Oscillospiraceae bacterium]|nr:purine-nucleoside phosphorylase [Oscillospiraceae bacterium]
MSEIYEKLVAARDYVRGKTDFIPQVAIVLGSGLGGLADEIECAVSIRYSDIPGFPVSTVAGHEGRFVFGSLEGVPVVAMQGRVHYYEGYDVRDVVLPVRLMGMLGAKTVFLTNAAGGINKGFAQGALMMITDHISSLVPSPLAGANIDELGVRFPDMSEVYSGKLREIIRESAEKLSVDVKEGIYIQTAGPNYETPAEIRAYERMGADAVGMSTAIEAMAARHMGMQVCGISCITNMAAGLSPRPLTHEEVKETADRVSRDFKRLVRAVISEIHRRGN